MVPRIDVSDDALDTRSAAGERVAEHFLVRLRTLFDAIDHLELRAKTCLAENLAALGFRAGEEVPLAKYVAEGRRSLDKKAAFAKLLEHFAA